MSKILIVSDFSPFPPNEGNKRRLFDLIALYRSVGLEVHLAIISTNGDVPEVGVDGCVVHGLKMSRLDAARRFLWRLVAVAGAFLKIRFLRTYSLDAWCPFSVERHLHGIASAQGIEVIQAEYVYLSGLLEAVPAKLKILDAHDIFGGRWELFERQGSMTTWYSISKKDEDRGLARADVVLAISQSDFQAFKSRQACKELICLDYIQSPVSDPGNARDEVVFIGSANRMNREGLQWFVDKVLSEVLSRYPGFVLSVYGAVGKGFEGVAGLRVCGRFADVGEVLARARLMLNTVNVGTGLPMKNLDSLAHGVPVLCTPNAARGAEAFIGQGVIVADDASAYCKQIFDLLYTDSEEIASLRVSAKVRLNGLYQAAQMSVRGFLK